jgi:hypothetical protein
MFTAHFLLLAAAGAIVPAVFMSCSQTAGLPLRTEPVTFVLPSWPPEKDTLYPPLSYWSIQYCSGSSAGTFTVDAKNTDKASFTLEISGGIPCAVTAQPVTRHGNTESAFFYPAGCIYPPDSSIAWEEGFPASVCMQLYLSSESSTDKTADYLAKFNWQKLSGSLKERAAAGGPAWNPWMLDRTAICRAAAAHTFSTKLLVIKNSFSVQTALLRNNAQETSRGTESCSEILLIPQYIHLYKKQCETGTTALKKEYHNRYLYTMQQIAIVTGSDPGSLTLEITAVPLYTEK